MTNEKNPESLEGKLKQGTIVGGRFEIEEFKTGTIKSDIYRAHNIELDIPAALKVTNEGVVNKVEFENLITDEGETIKELRHPNIVGIQGAGEIEEGLGQYYLALDWAPGRNLRELTSKGEKRFSMQEIVDIGIIVLGALQYASEHESPHVDVKLDNIIFDNEAETLEDAIKITDFGKWSTYNPDANFMRDHVSGTAIALEELLGRGEIKPTKKLKKILAKAEKEKSKYTSPQEFQQALESYKWWSKTDLGITRRNFPKLLIGLVAGSAIGHYGGEFILNTIKNNEKRRKKKLQEEKEKTKRFESIGYTKERIRDTKKSDFTTLEELYVELGRKICNKKLRLIFRNERVESEEAYPYATNSEDSWLFTRPEFLTSGYSISVLEAAAHLTEDKSFREKSQKLRKRIVYNEGKERGFSPVRFLHVGREIDKAAEYFEEVYNQNERIYEFDKFLRVNKSPSEILLDTISLTGPMQVIMEASKSGKKEKRDEYMQRIVDHTDRILTYMIREDGSTREMLAVNENTGNTREEMRNSFATYGCNARIHAGTIDWLVDMFQITNDQRYIDQAQRLQTYFERQLPDDGIPFADLHPEYAKKEGAYKDTSAMLRDIKTLTKRAYELGQENQKQRLYDSLYDTLKHIPGEEREKVIVEKSCSSLNRNQYTDSCIIWAVEDLTKSISIIKKERGIAP